MGFLNKLVVWTLPFVPKFFVGQVSRRYIAGPTLDHAVSVVKKLNTAGCCATLDVLGEHIHNKGDAEKAVQQYLIALDRIHQEKLDANISVKLTMLGLKLGFDFCLQNVRKLVEHAEQLKNFVRIDMEDSSCTSDTLKIYHTLKQDFDNVGFVIQAYMRRSLQDIRAQANRHAKINVRLCKGIYNEPREIAYKDKEIINWNFTQLLHELLSNGHYAGIATHDEKLVWEAYKLIDKLKLKKDDFEFQMLLGVDEELRNLILKDGYKLRVYVPFGQQWYEYSTRRLKENPQVAGHIIKNFFRIK
ncbi:MAG: proline dehydrogenase family protein [bacterium]